MSHLHRPSAEVPAGPGSSAGGEALQLWSHQEMRRPAPPTGSSEYYSTVCRPHTEAVVVDAWRCCRSLTPLHKYNTSLIRCTHISLKHIWTLNKIFSALFSLFLWILKALNGSKTRTVHVTRQDRSATTPQWECYSFYICSLNKYIWTNIKFSKDIYAIVNVFGHLMGFGCTGLHYEWSLQALLILTQSQTIRPTLHVHCSIQLRSGLSDITLFETHQE